jgi:hypothetical protein
MRINLFFIIILSILSTSCSKNVSTNNDSNYASLIRGNWTLDTLYTFGIIPENMITPPPYSDSMPFLPANSFITVPYMNFENNGMLYTLDYLLEGAGSNELVFVPYFDTLTYKIIGDNIIINKLVPELIYSDTLNIQTLSADRFILFEKPSYYPTVKMWATLNK